MHIGSERGVSETACGQQRAPRKKACPQMAYILKHTKQFRVTQNYVGHSAWIPFKNISRKERKLCLLVELWAKIRLGLHVSINNVMILFLSLLVCLPVWF